MTWGLTDTLYCLSGSSLDLSVHIFLFQLVFVDVSLFVFFVK